jgi:hypothetical protein
MSSNGGPAGDPSQDLLLWYALYSLTTRYWRDVDFNSGRKAHEFYQSDGVFIAGKNRFEGHDNIRAFYTWRERHGQTTTRHLISNLLVAKADGRRATAVGMMSLHRSDVLAAGAKGEVPILVADFTSDCARGDDDVWRFASHQLDPIFVSGTVPLSLAVDPRFLAASRPS